MSIRVPSRRIPRPQVLVPARSVGTPGGLEVRPSRGELQLLVVYVRTDWKRHRDDFRFTCRRQGIAVNFLQTWGEPLVRDGVPVTDENGNGLGPLTAFECLGAPAALNYLSEQRFVERREQADNTRLPFRSMGSGPEKLRPSTKSHHKPRPQAASCVVNVQKDGATYTVRDM